MNIDVSAEKDGFFADTGASIAVPPVTRAVERMCRDGRRAMWTGCAKWAPAGHRPKSDARLGLLKLTSDLQFKSHSQQIDGGWLARPAVSVLMGEVQLHHMLCVFAGGRIISRLVGDFSADG